MLDQVGAPMIREPLFAEERSVIVDALQTLRNLGYRETSDAALAALEQLQQERDDWHANAVIWERYANGGAL